jgi:hypothetical protein
LSVISSTTGSEFLPTSSSINLRRSSSGSVNLDLLGFVDLLGKIALNVTYPNNSNLRIAPDFNASKGIWKYNDTIRDFVKTDTASDIVIEFPDSSNYANKTGVNNCVYTIQQLQTQIVSNTSTTSGSNLTDTLITQLTANLYISGTKEMDLSFTGTYNNNNQLDKVNYVLDYGIYTYSVNLLVALPTETWTEELKKSGTTVYSLNYNASLQGDTIFKVTLVAGDLQVAGNYDFPKFALYLNSISSVIIHQTATDSILPYPYYTGTISQVSTSAKIGDIEMLRIKQNGGTYSTTTVVVYKDGTYDPLSVILSSVSNYLLSLIGVQ